MKKFLGIIMAVIGILILAAGVIFKLKGSMSLSFGGRANGPTSVFLVGKVGNSSFMIEMIVGVVLFVAGIFTVVKKK